MNRSEELAKLLGVEPVHEAVWNDVSNFSNVKTFKTLDEAELFVKENNHPYSCSGFVRTKMVDFTLPENFVKLQKIKAYTNVILFQELAYNMFDYEPLENCFIDRLIYILGGGMSDKWIESVKQQAQATKWTY